MLHSYQLSDMQFLRSHSEQQITNNALVLFSIFFYFLLLLTELFSHILQRLMNHQPCTVIINVMKLNYMK